MGQSYQEAVEAIAREEQYDRRPTAKELHDFVVTLETWNEARKNYQEDRDYFIKGAALLRETAVSHRPIPFKVGCLVLAIEPSVPGGKPSGAYVYQASNFKPYPGERRGEDKRCAERNALDYARQYAKVVVAITTISKEVSTGDPTKAHDALHPCGDCRDMLRKLLREGFLRDDTIITNANDSKEKIVFEERNLKELLDLYSDDEERQSLT